MINLSTTGLTNNSTNSDRESDSISDNEYDRKSYPQRHNRTKLNYRDLERGMYEDIRQSMWTNEMNQIQNRKNDEVEFIDLCIDDDDDDDNNGTNQLNVGLWCICNGAWDHLRRMLRCDTCANWYHSDCVGVTKEEAKELDKNGENYICMLCRDKSKMENKRTKSYDESIQSKRKRSDEIHPINNNKIRANGNLSKSISLDESTKKPKTKELSLTETPVRCISQDCNKIPKSDWVYCSSTCIRRHINDTLEIIQQSKGRNSEDIPTRDDISLYERKTKKYLEKKLIPNIEDLSTWIHQHPSYEIIKQSTNSRRTLSSVVNKLKSNQVKNKKQIKLIKPSNQIKSNIITVATDIRTKVTKDLYEKIIMRLQNNNEQDLITNDIQLIVKKIEEEMFRVYRKVDTAYKNKYRSLLSNISNTNNNFFYKYILSKDVTPAQIVAMEPKDMVPPEEKEKRKDQLEKEVQMILDVDKQTAQERARLKRMKGSKQDFIDIDTTPSMIKSKEQSLSEEKINETVENISKSVIPINDTKLTENSKNPSSSLSENRPPVSLTKPPDPIEPSKVTIPEQSNPVYTEVDLDNDYIEPESPTGIDALIYDDDDNNNNTNTTIDDLNRSSDDNPAYIPPPIQPIIRDDYNPSKIQQESKSICKSSSKTRLSNQWHGVIYPSDTKIPCQSVHVYGEGDYLIGNIPEQLTILGRLRLGDLWDYIRESIPVRDVIILTLISSSSTTKSDENDIFSQYFDTMFRSGRAAVLNKCTNTSLIRDMYILAADTKHCPSSVLSSLFLPITFESKQLFLVIIGTGKTKIKSLNRSNESLHNITYKPVALQNLTSTRDPRLPRNKDSRFNGREITNDNNSSIPTIVIDDNLTEENMDVDDEQDDKHKKQITTSSNSEFNDIDYRFLNQDMDHLTTSEDGHNHRKQRRKSRFSDALPINNEPSKKEGEESIIIEPVNRIDNVQITSSKSSDKHIINLFSKEPIRQYISSTKQTLPINSTPVLNLLMQQQKTKNRFSSSINEWRSNRNDNYMTYYHDFDRPQE